MCGESNHVFIFPKSRKYGRGWNMPVLMLALLALGAFAAIGLLLATAVVLESRSHKQMQKH